MHRSVTGCSSSRTTAHRQPQPQPQRQQQQQRRTSTHACGLHRAAGSSVPSPSASRNLCCRPQATASPDIKADDTAEARRRLARQFRRHKLQPQHPAPAAADTAATATTTGSTAAGARLRGHGLLPKPRSLSERQQQLPPLSSAAAWQQSAPPADASAAAAAAARELLEWHFNLGPAAGSAAGGEDETADAEQQQQQQQQQQRRAPPPPSGALLLGLSASGDAGRHLTNAIMNAQHWRQVQSLIQEHGPECLNTRHLCAALTRLVHLQHSFVGSSSASASRPAQQPAAGPVDVVSSPQATAFIQHLYAELASHLGELEYRQACNVVWATSKLQHAAAPGASWVAALYRRAAEAYASEKRLQEELAGGLPEARQQAQQLEQQVYALRHAAQLSYALVKLQAHLPAAQVQELVAWVLGNTREILQQHIQQHQPSTTSSSSSSSSSAAQQRVARPLKHQQQLGARDLATIAWSLASLCPDEPSPAWLSAFAAALSCRGLVSAGNYQDLSQLLWSLATFSKHAPEGSAAANSIHAAASAVLGAAQDTHLASCDGQALANVLWALATLGTRPQLPYLQRLLLHAEAAASRGFVNAQGISMTLWGLAALGVTPPPPCMAALQASAAQQLPHMTPQGVSNVLWALAVLERPPSKDWLAAFWPACRALLPDMTLQGVINCLWASARLGLQPPQEWLADVAGLLLQDGRLRGLTPQGVTNVIWAMSRISVSCKAGADLLSASLQQAAAMLEQQVEQGSADAEAEASSNSSDAAVLNIFELSGLMHAVCQLQRQQGAAAISGGAAPAALLARLTALLQAASLPLLPTAAPSELAILLWSQVAMPVPASQLGGDGSADGSLQQPQQQAGATQVPAPVAAAAALPIPRAWLAAWFEGSSAAFPAASSRDLSNWIWCLAKRGLRPPQEWLASWQVASFRQMPRATSQDLSNSLWALAALRLAPDPAWLQRALLEFHRRQLQKAVWPQHHANVAHALAKLGHRPDRDWALRYQDGVLALLPHFKPQELSTALWAMATLNMRVEEGLLAAVVAHMSARLPAYKANEVAVSLWALSRLRGQPGLRLMAAALQHCFSQARQLTPQGLSMLLWSVGNMSTPPPKAWVAKLLVATQVRMAGFSAPELSMLVVSLARLEYRPSDAWLDGFAAAAAAKMGDFGAQGLANVLWALATLHFTPPAPWMAAFDRALARHLPAFTPAHVAMTLWALSRLQWLPAPALWQQLQERAELHSAHYCLRSQRMLLRAVRVLEGASEDEEDEEEDAAVGRGGARA